mmetsp:Transcript_37974/g.89752  ORF Transcript_37974/g.89752 Transcript_37974/m.89752 type:complete len:137 (-) Transcript_37974:20-430(-)
MAFPQMLTYSLEGRVKPRLRELAARGADVSRTGFLARSLRPTDAAFLARANATLRAGPARTGARTRRLAPPLSRTAAVSRTARPGDSLTLDARADVVCETARVGGLDRRGETQAGGVHVAAHAGQDSARRADGSAV